MTGPKQKRSFSIKLNAPLLRYVLFVLLLLLIAGGAAGFLFIYDRLRDYNKETAALNAQIDMSDANLTALHQIEQYLKDHQQDIDNSTNIVAETQQYRYQDEIIKDIYSFANKSNVGLVSISFSEATTTPTTGSSGTETPGPQPAVSGLTSKTADVTIQTPVNYNNLLSFIHRIEQNRTKMQIASISLSRGDRSDTVTSDSFMIEVYTR